MSALRAETVIATRKCVVSKKVASEYMLLHLESGDYFELNETANEFWRLADGRRTLGEISSRAAGTLGISPETAKKDALEFFKTLCKYDLIDVP